MFFLKFKLLLLLTMLLFVNASFSQLPAAYYRIFNEGVYAWQMKPKADYEKAFSKFIQTEQFSDRRLIVNPFISYDEEKSNATELKDGNRRYVRFMLNMHKVRPDLEKKFNPLNLAWNMSEKIKSINFRNEILKSLISKQTDENKDQLKTLFNRLEQATNVFSASSIEENINEIIPDYKILSQQAVSLEEIKSVLNPGEILLSFLMTDNRRHVFVWKIEKNKAIEIVALKINTADLFFRIECLKADFENNNSFKDSLINFYIPLEKNDLRDGRNPAPPFTNHGYTSKEILKGFSESIIEPLHLSEGSKLVIACDQNISALPFEIIPFKNKMMFDFFDISYIPSAKVLYFLRKRSSPNIDPQYNSYCGFAYDDNGKLSNAEITAFKGAKNTIIQKSSETDVYSYKKDISISNIVHFSTHGKIKENHNGTITQFLQYYPDTQNDGILTSAEIINKLRFNNSLVVLSACQTAPSLDINEYFDVKEFFDLNNKRYFVFGGCLCSYGETFSNLTSAFFIAGARNLIMTQWNIKAKASTEFFEIFYEKLIEFQDISKALKETKKDLIQNNNYALYGAFILVSD